MAAWRYVGVDEIALHETALQIYGLAEIEPRSCEFIVPRTARQRSRGPLFRLHVIEAMPTSRVFRGVCRQRLRQDLSWIRRPSATSPRPR